MSQATAEAKAPQEQDTVVDRIDDGAVSPKSSNKRPLLVIAAICIAGASVLAMNGYRPDAPQKLPDPVVSSVIVPVPQIPPAPIAASTLIPDVMSPVETVLPAPAAQSLPEPVSHGGGPLPGAGQNDKEVQNIAPNIQSDLPPGQRDISEKLLAISTDLADIKEQLAKLVQARHRPASPPAKPRNRVSAESEAKVNSGDAAQLLSIDLWDGKPSIVVARGRGRDADITFLNEGEKQGRITVKKADVGTQQAVLGTDKGDLILSKDE